MKIKKNSLKINRMNIGLAAVAIFALSGSWLIHSSSALNGECSGYTQVTTAPIKSSSGAAGPGTIVLYKNAATATKYCAVLNHTGAAQGSETKTTVTLRNAAGTTATDSGSYQYYAGPVTVAVSSTGCTTLSGSMVWKGTTYSYSAASWCIAAPAPKPPTPAPTPPAPAPTPTPPVSKPTTPSPTPTTRPSPSPTPGSPSPSPTTPTPTAPPTADANGGAVAGSLAAALTVPNGNASKIHIVYGTDPAVLSDKTDDKDAGNDQTEFVLTGLKPATAYSYQIVRTNILGQSATSPVATFNTANFTVVLRFVNNDSDPIAGVSGAIKSTEYKGKSDKDGTLSFSNLKPGDYTVSYTYKSATHTLPIIVDASGVSQEDASKITEAKLEYYVNVDKVSVTSATKKPAGHSKLLILWIVLGLLAAGGIIFFIVRRRRMANPYEEAVEESYQFNTSDEPEEPVAPPPAAPPVFPTLDEPSDIQPVPALATTPVEPESPHASDIHAGEPLGPNGMFMPDNSPEHMGLSLKQMVLRSMQEETARNKAAAKADLPHDSTDPPHTPQHGPQHDK